jgi:hypothetical protein
MKTRSGFVSNSSSSSFIVAFNRKPESVDETLQLLFGEDTNGLIKPEYYDNGLTHREVAERVFADIQRVGPSSVQVLVNDLASRYWRYKGKLDVGNSPFLGTDHSLVDKMIELYNEYEHCDDRFNTKMERLKKKYIGKDPGYASHERKSKKDRITAYEAYCKAEAEFEKTNPEFRALDEDRRWANNEYLAKQATLENQLANIDFKSFQDSLPPTAYVAHLSYSDNVGEKESIMEHGGVFNNVPHIRISHH